MSLRFCPQCQSETEYKECIKQKPSPYGKSRKETVKAFFSGFFSGMVVGPALASLELIDRYEQCQTCGHLTLDNHGEEFK